MATKTREFSEEAGEIIRDLRQKQGLTQEELGQQLDIGKQAVYAVEQGHRRITLDRLSEYLEALDHNLQFFARYAKNRFEDSYHITSLVEVSRRMRQQPADDTFRLSLREMYRYIARRKDPVSIVAEPLSTGDRSRDAYLAGGAEAIAHYYNWGVPDWTDKDWYFLSEPYFPGSPEGMKVPLWQSSPGYFRVRNIFVDETAVVGPLEKFSSSTAGTTNSRG